MTTLTPTQTTFEECSTISDFFVKIADMQPKREGLARHSFDAINSSSNVTLQLYIAVKAYEEAVRNAAEEGIPVKSEVLIESLGHITRTGDLRQRFAQVLTESITAETIDQNVRFVPEHLVEHVWSNDERGVEVRLTRDHAKRIIKEKRAANNALAGLDKNYYAEPAVIDDRAIAYGPVEGATIEELISKLYERRNVMWKEEGKLKYVEADIAIPTIYKILNHDGSDDTMPQIEHAELMAKVLAFKAEGATMPDSFSNIYRQEIEQQETQQETTTESAPPRRRMR